MVVNRSVVHEPIAAVWEENFRWILGSVQANQWEWMPIAFSMKCPFLKREMKPNCVWQSHGKRSTIQQDGGFLR